MANYHHILAGLPIMYLIVVVAMCVVIGAMCMDALIHFVWAQFSSSSIHCVPLASILVAITLCIVEIWSMREKAEEKTRNNINHAIKVVADAISREEAVDIAKHIIDKASEEQS